MSKPGQMVLVALRKMIASGELAAGERLMEIPTAERFGVSRMPVRMAFVTLEQEGLLVRHGGRGYQIRSVSADDIAGAVEVRGVLEGLADVCICAPGGDYADRVQELHIKVLHILIELIERKLSPQNYA